MLMCVVREGLFINTSVWTLTAIIDCGIGN